MTHRFESFWNRFANKPQFAGKRILEVGCGGGELSIQMGRAGASSVVGIDILPEKIMDANARLQSDHADLTGRILFTTRRVDELDLPPFDLIVSKDAFEHIIDVPTMLAAMRQQLAPAGTVYIGFSPLYHSPYGDHDRRRKAFGAWGIGGRLLALLPWGHLFLERQIIRRHEEITARPVRSMHDLNLNMMSIVEFRDYLELAGFRARYFAVNRGGNPLGWPFSALRHFPLLEKYCTYNVYCELELSPGTSGAS